MAKYVVTADRFRHEGKRLGKGEEVDINVGKGDDQVSQDKVDHWVKNGGLAKPGSDEAKAAQKQAVQPQEWWPPSEDAKDEDDKGPEELRGEGSGPDPNKAPEAKTGNAK